MSSEDEQLMGLYARRQTILKELSEVDTEIKLLETKISAKSVNHASRTVEMPKTGNVDIDKASELVSRSMQDAAGLRDALKMVEACRQIQQYCTADATAAQKVTYRNAFVHECIRRADELYKDGNGSELLHQAVGLLLTGTTPAVLQSIDYSIADGEKHPSEVMLLLSTLGKEVVAIACNTNGARVAQSVIEKLETMEEMEAFVGVVEPSIVELGMDINGNHSLSKLVVVPRFLDLDSEAASEQEKQRVTSLYDKVFRPISDNCIDICKNRQGCCIIQKCLQWAPEPYHAEILQTVLSSALKLVQDPFGNYVVQFILDKQQDITGKKKRGEEAGEGAAAAATAPNYTNQIIRHMLHHVADLSCNKFSSNVIEKCLKTSSSDVRQLLVDELTDPRVLPKLLTDGFANYVIQTAISTASDDGQFTQLRDAILPLLNLLKNSPYGVKIEAKLSRRHREAARRQTKRKETSANVVAPPPPPMAQQETNMMPSYMPIQMMQVQDNGGMGQQMAFANISPEMATFFNPQQMVGMPFVVQSQPIIGIAGSAPPQYSMGMINDGRKGNSQGAVYLPEYR